MLHYWLHFLLHFESVTFFAPLEYKTMVFFALLELLLFFMHLV